MLTKLQFISVLIDGGRIPDRRKLCNELQQGNSGGTGSGNVDIFSQNGLYGIPPWLLYLMYLEWRNQRLNQYYGGSYGNQWNNQLGNQYGQQRSSSFKRSIISEIEQLDQAEVNSFMEFIRNNYSAGRSKKYFGNNNSFRNLGNRNMGKSVGNQGRYQGNKGVLNKGRHLHSNNAGESQRDKHLDELLRRLIKELEA